ncbi:MAG: CDP-diacylglycerol--serine O-phosphatidyltransferase [Candidatus Omnitrophica bacterium CG23_combo_of_CG06-09_8_20_14_all_41_10]|uniref:CDP-diacylglycerol--serine O-phosphatidyltransferase n=1 Tax=Candidatus Sherwoodlollariibacterium unditelluris TaxID=1974757 RepID=A0A2G9YJS4_9BACT|nr:MAG: CDP-diacylglycerol--serine O-phosphatidyltransferase [Candidatus Omnitrophica bacterium CG23_combo_of_CG06-09_8_20_14_all_41_10]
MVFVIYLLEFNFRTYCFLFLQGFLQERAQVTYLANLLTILSLFCGFASVILSLEGHFTFSALVIILSVIFDGLDGQVARKSKSSSDFGKELDSLVDVVSFGIAPALLGYIFIYDNFHFSAAVALFIYLLCAVIRLAKYNTTPQEAGHNYFTGLPITVSGGMLASFVLIYRKAMFLKFIPVLFISLVLLLASLMVSAVRFPNLDGLRQFLGKRLKVTMLSLFLILSLALYLDKAGLALFLIFLTYLIFSPFVVKRLDSI